MSNEDFDTQSLATFLHLTPSQIEKMASREKIPGRKIGGKWRFSRAEIHHWFEERIGASDAEQLQQVERVLVSQPSESVTAEINIVDLMSPQAICIPLQSRTRNSVIEDLCEHAVQAGLLWDAESMADAIRAREDLHPTALENGVAMLHPRRPQPDLMAEPFIALGITSGGIPFGGPRGTLTDIFFLIASCDDPGHLRVLARLSRLVSDPAMLDQLRESTSTKDALDIIFTAEDALI